MRKPVLTKMTGPINYRIVVGTKFATNLFWSKANNPYPLLPFSQIILLFACYLASMAFDTSGGENSDLRLTIL